MIITHKMIEERFAERISGLKNFKESLQKTIETNPNHIESYWNLHTLVSSIDEALVILKKIYEIDSNNKLAKIMIVALEGYKGKNIDWSIDTDHPYTRSIKWVFTLPKLPNIFFDRWSFFDAVIKFDNPIKAVGMLGTWDPETKIHKQIKHQINISKKNIIFHRHK